MVGVPGPGITPGLNQDLWFTEDNINKIGRITTAGAITDFRTPTSPSNPYNIVTGSDGNIWFPEITSNNIGRVSVSAAPGAMALSTLTPCRVADTRITGGAAGPSLHAAFTRTLPLAGQCGIPASARAISVNVTVTGSTQDGYLVLFPGSAPRPASSTLNYRANQTRANNAVIGLGPGGTIAIFCGQATGFAELILDVSGYFE